MPRGELTPGQRLLLRRLRESLLGSQFYLTGGTALSSFFLHHRLSLDLDLFSREPFDAKKVVRFVNEVADGPVVAARAQDRYVFTVPIGEERVRVEFVHYDYDCVSPPLDDPEGVPVDSERDILANKLSAIVERTESKDFVDLYFLLHRPGMSLAQGMEDCQKKFGWPGLQYLLQTAFMRVPGLPDWPVTEPPVAREVVAAYFRELAASLFRPEEG